MACERKRMQRIADMVRDLVHAHPEWREGDRFIFAMDTDDDGLITAEHYSSDVQVISDLLGHITVIGEAGGVAVNVITIPDDIEGAE